MPEKAWGYSAKRTRTQGNAGKAAATVSVITQFSWKKSLNILEQMIKHPIYNHWEDNNRVKEKKKKGNEL